MSGDIVARNTPSMRATPARTDPPATAAGTRRATRGRPARYSREELLGIIVAVFNERGYEAASMADLAAATGLTKSAFYHHFTSKEELLQMAVDRALTELSLALDRATARAQRPVDRLERAIRLTAETLIDELPYVTLLLRIRGNTDIERDALARRRTIDARLAALVGEAAEAGEIRDDIDPRLVSRLLFGMINSIHEWYRPGRRTGSRRSVVDGAVGLALVGLRQCNG